LHHMTADNRTMYKFILTNFAKDRLLYK
jgi:hypothetical protein